MNTYDLEASRNSEHGSVSKTVHAQQLWMGSEGRSSVVHSLKVSEAAELEKLCRRTVTNNWMSDVREGRSSASHDSSELSYSDVHGARSVEMVLRWRLGGDGRHRRIKADRVKAAS